MLDLLQVLVRNCKGLFEYSKDQETRNSVLVFCAVKLELMKIKPALLVLNDILAKLIHLSKTF